MNDTFATPHPFDAEAELASRELANRTLIDFTTYTYPRYIPEAFHIEVSGILSSLIGSKRQRKIMIFAPPQHGKSELVSVRFPAYWLAKKSDRPVIICSYGALLAMSKAGQTKSIIGSKQYENIFPDLFTTEDAKENIRNYKLSLQKKISSAGVGGSITGFGAGLGIIDDPFRSWADAQSENQRRRVWEWYQGTFRTRIWNKGHIVIIMTRWHEDDLCGRLLKEQADEWEIYRFPAIAETQEERDASFKQMKSTHLIGQKDLLNRGSGEPLCPIRYPLHSLLTLKKDVGLLAWTAEYQGIPRAPGGNLIKKEWLHIISIEQLPNRCRFVRFWDLAGTAGGGAYTIGLLMAMFRDRIYIVDIVRGRWSTFSRDKIIVDTATRDKKTYGNVKIIIEREGGSAGVDMALIHRRKLAGFSFSSERPTGDKLVRLDPFMGWAEAGLVYMIDGAWNEAYIEEMIAVPNNAYWDQADATSGAFSHLAKTYREMLAAHQELEEAEEHWAG